MAILHALVPEGRWRQAGKWAATVVVALVAVARMHLGVEAPSDVVVGVGIGVTIPLLGFRWFTPNEAFRVTYRRGEPRTWTSVAHAGRRFAERSKTNSD